MFGKLRTLFGRDSAESHFKINGHKMAYLEINHANTSGQPLIIGVHGYGASETQMRSLVNIELPFAHTYVAPRALQKHPTGGFMWFPIEGTSVGFDFDEEAVNATLDRLDAFIEVAIDRYQADPRRVIFVGYSQGGMLAFRYLLRHPQRVMGAVALAGSFSPVDIDGSSANELDGKGLFIGYGTKDIVITSQEMQMASDYFRALDVDVTCRAYPIPHVVSQAEVADIETWLKLYLDQSSLGLDSQVT